jgi:hypothetical protein
MNSLTPSSVAPVTMTSLQLVEYINSLRKIGEPELTHANFLAKVVKVLPDTSHSFECDLPDTYGRSRKGYKFPKREACLMAMSYSYELQAVVYDRMTELEAQVAAPSATTLPRTPTDLAVNHITGAMQLAALFEVPTHLAQAEAVKGARLTYHIDFTEMLRLAPAQSMIRLEDEALEPTELGKLLSLSAIKTNQWLEQQGFQAKINGEWVPTDKGKPFAVRHQWVSGNKSGYNYKWKKSVLKV